MSPGIHEQPPSRWRRGRGNSAPKRCKERFQPAEFGEEDQQNNQPTETKSTKTSKQINQQPTHPSKWHDFNPKVYVFKSMSFVFKKNPGAPIVEQSWRFVSCSDDADGRQPMKHKGSDLEGPRGVAEPEDARWAPDPPAISRGWSNSTNWGGEVTLVTQF